MNKSKQTSFRVLLPLLCLITMGVYGQKESKTFKETFIVANDAILDINTSHADIEFETWNGDKVVIEGLIEIEGATKEEAKDYFQNAGFEILGNSKKVSIKTQSKNSWVFNNVLSDTQNFQIEIPNFSENDVFNFNFDFAELQDMPALPAIVIQEFDHEAFDKEGEKYLKEWQKEFEKGYDKEHIEKLEKWAKKMEERQEELQKKREEKIEIRLKEQEKRIEEQAERMERVVEARVKQMEAQQVRRVELIERRNYRGRSKDSLNFIIINSDSMGTHVNRPSIFYSSAKGDRKNYKVKKTIKIKMPKGMKIKMNVRHGEVKLAELTKNLNATLSHSSLWASTIDGEETLIKASYSPVNVQNWNFGALQANYSERVDLKKVTNLRLNANSSDVTIDNLIATVFIKNDFGPLRINSVSKNFKEIDISLQNAQLNCNMPTVPFTIYVNGTSSRLTSPDTIAISESSNGNSVVYKGYYKDQAANRSIVINSKYSEVIIK